MQKYLPMLAFFIIGAGIGLGAIMLFGNKPPENTSKAAQKMQNDTKPQGEVIIEDIVVGEGEEVQPGDTVVMHYTGTFTDSTKFDSSVDRNTPFETQIGVGAVIQGWDEGVPGMKIGGKRRLTIPPDLAYGAQGYGDIPPNATLIFEVELLEIKQ